MQSQKEIELILARQLASNLSIPIFLVDTGGNLLYYNGAAEPILGQRFSETGGMTMDEWSTVFALTDESGEPIPPNEAPLAVALTERRPVHRTMTLVGLDGVRRGIQATCIPILGQADRYLGALALFWEVNPQ